MNIDVRSVLANEHAPLILACVGYLAPIYANENSYSNLIREKVPGSPDKWTLDELRDRAWQFVEPIFRQRETIVIEQWNQARHGELASDDLQDVLTASQNGRVDSLLVARAQEHFAHLEKDENERTKSDDQQGRMELLNQIVAQTLLHGGEVYSLDCESMPTGSSPIAALFRYPVA